MEHKKKIKYINKELQVACLYGIIDAMLQDMSAPKREKYERHLGAAQQKGFIEPLNFALK